MAFSDYPESAVNNAKRALKWADENGWGSCGTPVGKSRANSIAKREKLSLDTVKRVYSFLSRHAQNADVPYDEGCGGLMYDAWGGKSMLPWARKTINKMEEKNNNHEAELRAQYGENVELRTSEVRAAGDDSLIVEGYASNFDVEYDLGYFKESVARGAFDDVLEHDVRFLLNHTGAPLARTTNGTLELTVDDTGLRYRAALADTQDGRDLYKLIKRGDITQSSFAFTIDADEWSEDRSTRTITKIGKLLDVSSVTYPASPSTTVAARNMAAAAQEAAELNDEQEAAEPATEERAEPETIKTEARNFTPINFSKMTLNDLKGQRSAYYEEFVGIGQKADSEGRTLTEAEQERCDKLDSMIADLDVKIKHKQREQEMVARMAQSGNVSASEQREVERVHGAFSISRAVAQIANGRNLEGAEAEWAQEAHKEARSQGLQLTGQIAIPSIALRALGDADEHSATTGSGSGSVATVVPAAIEALRAPTVIEGLGATVIRNATGNLQFPRIATKATGASATEAGANSASGLLMDTVSMQPERVSAKTTYTKQLILQGGVGIDTLIANDLSAAMNAYIDDRAFDVILADTDVDDQTAATGQTTDFSAMAVAMEAAVLAAGGNMAAARYAMSPEAYKLTKNAVAVTGVSALFENGQFNGFPATATPYLVDTADPYGQVVFGNFAQGLLLCYFGGLDLLVDPYSAAGNAQVTLHANRFFDVAVRQPGALSICKDLASA